MLTFLLFAELLAAVAVAQPLCDPPDGHSLDSVTCEKDVLFVDSNAQVGIGTTTPHRALEVDGTLTLSKPLRAGDGVEGNLSFNLLGLDAEGLLDFRWRLLTSDPDGGFGARPRALELWEYPADGLGIPGSCCRPRLVVESSYGQPSAPPALVLDGNGRVGVGTATPAAGLEIATGGLAVAGAPVIDAAGRWVGARVPFNRTVAICLEGGGGACCPGARVVVEESIVQQGTYEAVCKVTAETGTCKVTLPPGTAGLTGRCCVCEPL
jgi:hypothetical protein